MPVLYCIQLFTGSNTGFTQPNSQSYICAVFVQLAARAVHMEKNAQNNPDLFGATSMLTINIYSYSEHTFCQLFYCCPLRVSHILRYTLSAIYGFYVVLDDHYDKAIPLT